MPFQKPALLFFLFLFAFQLFAQERCGVVAYEKLRHLRNPKLETEKQFEEWIKSKLAEPKLKTYGTKETGTPTYTIPVVVHIIHNGEPIGTGTNISDAQVNSQIGVLNKDYQRLNADAINTPVEFQPVASSFDIEFVLAKQDPEGLATNGILRIQGTQTSWSMNDDATFKSLSYWPSEDYLNIWVINLVGGGLIGYAQFPYSPLPESELGGLPGSQNDPLTDGVVIHYRAFGSIADDPSFDLEASYNRGRTGTHEVGHFLGLRHIWGDDSGSCSDGGHFTDYVNDTPNQDNSTSGCPIHPKITCSVTSMFQNYLDYTNDVCMNLFTQGQISRMTTVLQNSPRRISLLTSSGANPPVVVSTDLGIKSIVSPGANACPGINSPAVRVRNYGTNAITTARLQVKQNGVIKETKDFSVSLSNLEEATLSFAGLSFNAASSNQMEFEVLLVNGATDDKASNDLVASTAVIPQTDSLPLSAQFNSIPTNWTIQNPDGMITWAIVDAPIGGVANKALYMNFFGYETHGSIDRIFTPVFDLSTTTTATLKVDKSYARFPGEDGDRLRVLVMTDCGADLSLATEVFNQSGSTLSTTTDTGNAFKPVTQSQWKNEVISLNSFVGMNNIRIVFEATNGYGNNLYLDNVVILTDDIIDVAITGVDSPDPVICETDPVPTIRVKNLGSFTVNSFTITTTNNGSSQSQTISGQSIITGEEKSIDLSPLALVSGLNTLAFEIKDPNNLPDQNTTNNTLSLKRVVNATVESIPLRENFEGSFQTGWTILSQGTQQPWQTSSTDQGISMRYPGYTNTVKGEEAWLVSPVLNLANAYKASVQFQVSYGKSSTGNERLKILSSEDCGITFEEVLFDLPGDQLSSALSNAAWVPTGSDQWKDHYVNLSNLVGNQNGRLAFIVTNDHGNNLYLDNLEFYVDDNPYPTKISSSFVVYPTTESNAYNITFNLPDKLTASIQVYNLMGQVLVDSLLPETLNQTYLLDLSEQSSGLYLVRLQAGNEISTTKIFIGR